MESELNRLQRLYHELGDEHLRDLADEPEDLTDEARLALAAEMRRRGFAPEPERDASPAPVPTAVTERESGFGAGIPGVFPSGAATVEQALEPGSADERDGFTGLHTFYDGHELTRACDALDDSDVEFAIEERSGDALVGAPPSFEIWVNATQQDLAQRVLREKLGLFPLPEVDDSTDPAGNSDLRLLGTFQSRAEAREAIDALTAAHLHPSLTEPDEADEESWWTVELPASELDRGFEVAAERLTAEPNA